MTERLQRWPRDRVAEWVSSSAYGTVLVLTALVVIDADDVSSGLGWELVSGVGIATWMAHVYAELVGDRLRHRAALTGGEIRRVIADGVPILLAALPPAVMLLLGRIDVMDTRLALGSAIVVAVLQLVGVGAFVGWVMSPDGTAAWVYTLATAAVGVAVVTVKFVLGH